MRCLHLLRCPHCGAPFDLLDGALTCQGCCRRFSILEEIPLLFRPNQWEPDQEDVTETVKAFYEEHPFPGYEDSEDLGSLIDKARKGWFARLLDEQIPFGTRVLDCGCGTGQLANFLGIAHRTVFGTDICRNSLRLAEDFRRTHGLERVHFIEMSLFHPVFPAETFDVVICNGVLHHTSRPYRGFQRLAGLVKRGGFLLLGLYHRFGRLPTDLKRLLFRISGDRPACLDSRLRRGELAKERQRAWFADQYRNPHEVKHTVFSVSRWMQPNGLKLIGTLPKMGLLEPFSPCQSLFTPQPAPHPLEQAIKEVSMLFSASAEGGFFTVIAQKEP